MGGWIKLALWLAVGYAVLVGLLYLGQRKLMYMPMGGAPGDPARYGLSEMRPVRVATADGLDLLAWYAAPRAEGGPVLVYFCGNAGHIGYRADKVRPYLDAGLGVFLLAYRGYSGNPGRPTERGLYADGRGALAYLEEAGVAPGRMVLYGESLGTGIAAKLAVERAREGRPVGAVVLESPFTSMADLAARHYPFVPARRLLKDRYRVLSRIAAIEAPLMVVHGKADTIVPAWMGERVLEAAEAPKEGLFVDGADHNDLYAFGVTDSVIDFIRRHIRQDEGRGKEMIGKKNMQK